MWHFADDVIKWKLFLRSWWRHQMKAFSVLLAICAGNLPATQRPVTRSFGFLFDLHPNNRLCKQLGAGDLRRHRGHYDVTVMVIGPLCAEFAGQGWILLTKTSHMLPHWSYVSFTLSRRHHVCNLRVWEYFFVTSVNGRLSECSELR